MVFNTEKQLKEKEFVDNMTETEKTEIEEIVAKLKVAHSAKNLDDIKTIKEELQQKVFAISAKIYAKQDQANKSAQDFQEPTSGKPDVEDVNFEEVK